MSVPESYPLTRFLAERSPSSDSRLGRRVAEQQPRSPPRITITTFDIVRTNEGLDDLSPPESPGSEGTSMMMSGNASLPALRRSSVGSLRSCASSSSIATPGPVEHGVPLLPLAPGAPMGVAGLGSRHPPAVLECPFIDLHCHQQFFNFNTWMQHSLEHFKDAIPPRNNRCVFCQQVFQSDSGVASWSDKLVCTAHHHVRESLTLERAHPDFALHRYLWEKGCITKAEWKALCELRSEVLRRGDRQRENIMGHAGPSPPHSPRDKDATCEQGMVVMTTNSRRERDIERRNRKIQQLQAQVDAIGED